ncbi:MAG: signal peptidase II [Rhodospirillaceae bacterium]|nr:signal peptidase II [Rhodospirillaceae bacterium]
MGGYTLLPFGLGCAAIVIAVDQLSKWLILTEVMNPPRVIEITGFLNLVLVSNKGVSFGLFSSDAVWAQPALASFAALVSILLVFWMRQAQHCFSAISLGLVVGGALGNAIDRLLHEAVVDFLDFHVAGYHWPVFNIADSAITVGVIFIIAEGLFADRKKTK